MAALSVSQCWWTVSRLERRLGAGDVQDDQVVDRLGLDERGHVGGDAVDGLSRGPRAASTVSPVPQPGDRPARRRSCVPGRTRAVAAVSSSWQAAIHSAWKTPEFRRNSSADSANDVCADIVAADDEIARLRQRQGPGTSAARSPAPCDPTARAPSPRVPA